MSFGGTRGNEINKRIKPTIHPYLIMVGIVIGVLMGALDNLIVTTAMPAIVGALHQPNGLAFLIDAYITSSAVGMVIFGKLSDHFSKKIILLVTLFIFIIGSILAGLSQNLPELIAFRAVQGLGSGGFLPVGLAVIAVILPPAARAKLTGAVTSFIGIAIVVGPEIGAFIVDTTSWRWVFYVNIPFGMVSFILVWMLLSPLKPILRGKFDYLGSILLASWISLLTLPLIEMAYSGWSLSDPLAITFLASGLVLLAFFLLVEMRIAKEPVIPLRMFRHKTIISDSFLSFFRGGVLFSLSTFIAIFVTEVLFGTANTLRNVLYGFVVPMVLGSILGGILLPKLSYRFFCIVGNLHDTWVSPPPPSENITEYTTLYIRGTASCLRLGGGSNPNRLWRWLYIGCNNSFCAILSRTERYWRVKFYCTIYGQFGRKYYPLFPNSVHLSQV